MDEVTNSNGKNDGRVATRSLLVGLFVGGMFVGLIMSVLAGETSVNSESSAPALPEPAYVATTAASRVPDEGPGKPVPEPTWVTQDWKNSETNKLSAMATSPTIDSKWGMDSPYKETQASLKVYCTAGIRSVSIDFSEQPDIVDAKPLSSGYSRFTTNVQWDDRDDQVGFKQERGGQTLYFDDDDAAISNLASANTMLLTLRWHGQRLTQFEFPLKGSSAAIQETLHKCS